jgi:hypothetical protein
MVVGSAVYIGGGDADDVDDMNDHVIMEYNITTKRWGHIECPVCYFTMTAIDNQLVRVGGYNQGKRSREVAVWGGSSRKWMCPYKKMSTARARSSVVVAGGWLVVAGGWPEVDVGHALSSIEVLDIAKNQWHRGPQTPTPWVSMRTACIASDHTTLCYFLGGYTSPDGEKASSTDRVYCASLKALTAAKPSHEHEVWTEVPSLPLNYSTPLSFSGSLYAFGGEDGEKRESAKIQCYQPDYRKWIEVGMLHSPRSKCTCAVLGGGEKIIVAGGNMNNSTFLKTAEIYS